MQSDSGCVNVYGCDRKCSANVTNHPYDPNRKELMNEEKVVPFIEHLVELRKRLVVIVIAVVVGMGVAWNFSGDLLKFVEKPLTGKTYLTEIKKDVYLK